MFLICKCSYDNWSTVSTIFQKQIQLVIISLVIRVKLIRHNFTPQICITKQLRVELICKIRLKVKCGRSIHLTCKHLIYSCDIDLWCWTTSYRIPTNSVTISLYLWISKLYFETYHSLFKLWWRYIEIITHVVCIRLLHCQFHWFFTGPEWR